MMRATMKQPLKFMVMEAFRLGNSRAKRLRETMPEVESEALVCRPVEPEVLGTEPETRTRTITFKKERLLVISQLNGVEGWCDTCGAMVARLNPNQAATVAAMNQPEIFRQIESGQLHYAETNEDAGLICLNSLLKQLGD